MENSDLMYELKRYFEINTMLDNLKNRGVAMDITDVKIANILKERKNDLRDSIEEKMKKK